MPEPAVIETRHLCKAFGMVRGADSITVGIMAGERVGIVGANGSGKTTFLNLLTGYYAPDEGRIVFMGRDCTGLSPKEMTQLGIARSFQVPQLYKELTVLENILLSLAAAQKQSANFWRPLYTRENVMTARRVLRRFALETHESQPVAQLPEGGRKILDVALSFALGPKLLLLDEPTSGVSIEDKFPVMDTLMSVLDESRVTTVFVEHDMDVVKRYGERVLVFDSGALIADGSPESILTRDDVRAAVFGSE